MVSQTYFHFGYKEANNEDDDDSLSDMSEWDEVIYYHDNVFFQDYDDNVYNCNDNDDDTWDDDDAIKKITLTLKMIMIIVMILVVILRR